MEYTSDNQRGIDHLSDFLTRVAAWETRDLPGVAVTGHMEGVVVRGRGSGEGLYFYPVTPRVIRACRINSEVVVVADLGTYDGHGAPGSAHTFLARILAEELAPAELTPTQ